MLDSLLLPMTADVHLAGTVCQALCQALASFNPQRYGPTLKMKDLGSGRAGNVYFWSHNKEVKRSEGPALWLWAWSLILHPPLQGQRNDVNSGDAAQR